MKKLLIILLLVVIAIAVIPFFLPNRLEVTVTRKLNYQVSKVYDQFYDLHKFTRFDAWTALDKEVKIDYSEPSVGIGSSYTWQSSKEELGTGSMYINNAEYSEFLTYDLQFSGQDKYESHIDFHTISNDSTEIIWTLKSEEVSYPYQYFNYFSKSIIEQKLENSLDRLEQVLQSNSNQPLQVDTQGSNIQIGEHKALTIVGIKQETTSYEEFNIAREESVGFITSFLAEGMGVSKEKLKNPIVYYLPESTSKKQVFIVGYFVDESNANLEEGVISYDIKAGKNLTGMHSGELSTLKLSHNRLKKYAAVKKFNISKDYWEVYNKNFTKEDTTDIQIVYPLKAD